MSEPLKLTVPGADFSPLKAGREVLLSGVLYSARDQAHQRLSDLLKEGRDLPVDLRGQLIYYMGPAPTPPGKVIGSCGPTTAGRMDPFAPGLLRYGIAGMIGKGDRTEEVYRAVKETKGVYFYAYGGCGALYAECVRSVSIAAFDDLGPEAIYRLEVEDFPVIVAMDTKGGSIYRR
jgi:fumarate hydratase subunit beta